MSSELNTNNYVLTGFDSGNGVSYTSYNTCAFNHIIDTKYFKLGDLTLQVQNLNNKKIRIHDLRITFQTTETGIKIYFNVGGLIDFNSLEDAKNYIIKTKKLYKKMLAIYRKLELDDDFE